MNQKAFSLVEIIVAIGIITLLTVLILPNYKGADKQFALERSAHKLAQDTRRVQEMAMSAKETGGSVPLGGYGIHFRVSWETYYELYADGGNYKYGGIGDIYMETINLEEGVYIKSVVPSSLSVNFMPPDPVVNIKVEAGDDKDNAIITLALKSDPTKEKIIKINKLGRVEVE